MCVCVLVEWKWSVINPAVCVLVEWIWDMIDPASYWHKNPGASV